MAITKRIKRTSQPSLHCEETSCLYSRRYFVSSQVFIILEKNHLSIDILCTGFVFEQILQRLTHSALSLPTLRIQYSIVLLITGRLQSSHGRR